MSKATPVVKVNTNASQKSVTTVYNVGDHVYYTVNGVSAPFIVTAVNLHGTAAKDGTLVSYTVVGDISGTSFPTKVARGPYVNVPLASLTDRA